MNGARRPAGDGRRVVFADLDGTILDASYRPAESAEALARLRAAGVPVVLSTSKSRAEVEPLRAEVGLTDPYIVENGSAILSPPEAFPFPVGRADGPLRRQELAPPLAEVLPRMRAALDDARVPYASFLEMDDAELARATGLSPDAARRAKVREYTATLRFDSVEAFDRARACLRAAGLTAFSGGRYLTVGAGGEKGRAVAQVVGWYRRAYGSLVTLAFGDSENDRSMLEAVDVPVLVQRPGGEWAPVVLDRLHRVDAIGPRGFARGVDRWVLG